MSAASLWWHGTAASNANEKIEKRLIFYLIQFEMVINETNTGDNRSNFRLLLPFNNLTIGFNK